MRQEGQVPVTRPVNFDSVAVPLYTESELAVIIAEDAPVLWVRLKEAFSESVYEAHGVGETTVNGEPSRFGLGLGFLFDGVDDSVFIGCDQLTNVPPRLLQEAEEFTVEALLSSDYVVGAGETTILRWGSYGVELVAYKFAGVDDSGYLRCRFYDEDSVTYEVEHYGATLFTPGVQFHAAATYNGTSFKLFVDGVLVDTLATTAIPHWGYSNDDTNGLGIATNGPFGGSFYEGRVAEAAIYASALTDARVLEHAEASRTATLYNEIIVDDWSVPTSLVGGSSFYLTWSTEQDSLLDPATNDLYTRASAKITIPETPVVAETYFWGLQVDFFDATGTQLGEGRTGLQWAPGYPLSKAVNWGGTDMSLVSFSGTVSDFPSELSNDNTRDYAWETNTEYTFEISSIGDGFWRATINGETIRDLEVPDSAFIANPVFFSQVFAACDDPGHLVKWRDPYLYDASDTSYYFPRSSRSFQVVDGCANTESYTDEGYFVMETGVTRVGVESLINLRGEVRFFSIFPEWPLAPEVPVDLMWSVKMYQFPYESYRIPIAGVYIDMVDAVGVSTGGYLEVSLQWDTSMDAFRTLRVGGGYDDGVDFHNFVDEGTTHETVISSDPDYFYLDFPWVTGTAYDFRLFKDGAVWKLYDGVNLLFSFPDYGALEGASLYSFDTVHQTYCGGLDMKIGIGEISAVSDAVTLELTSIAVDLDFADCSSDDVFAEDGYFMLQTNTTRTVPPGGGTVSVA